MSLFDVDKNIELIPITPRELKKDGWREEWAPYHGMWFYTDAMPVNTTRQWRFAKTIEEFNIKLELYYSHDLRFHRWVVWNSVRGIEFRSSKYPETMDQLNIVVNELIQSRK
jgi:hypothetical protein